METEEREALNFMCDACGSVGFVDGLDGYYYCKHCNHQAEEIFETGVAEEDFQAIDTGTGLYQASHARSVTKSRSANQFVHISQQSSFWSPLFEESTTATTANDKDMVTITGKHNRKEVYYEDAVGPTEPQDFGGNEKSKADYEDYHFEVKMKYVMGVQLMIQLQCEALVEKFNVCPLICGVAGSIWLRFVATTGVLCEEWGDEAIHESESQKTGESKVYKLQGKYSQEPRNLYGQRAVIIWYTLLRQKIPLSSSLAISFLACHVVREPILPTDLVKWSIEGKLPYFAAFVEIEKRFGKPSVACSISPSVMFRPSKSVPIQKLESMAASIAESIGLHLPPVNFYAIASRYLKQLSLPMEKILPHALKIQEWSMAPDLWLSTNEWRLPSRVCVMSILIVAIRILYNINGLGFWERSLSSRKDSSSTSNLGGKLDPECSSKMRDDTEESSESPSNTSSDFSKKASEDSSYFRESELDAEQLLYNLEARYNDIHDTYEYSKDLPTYLQYCKDVVFAGLEPPHDDHEETRMIEQFWNFYQKEKESEAGEDFGMRCGSGFNQKRSRDDISLDIHSQGNKKLRECTTRLSADCESSNEDDFCSHSLNSDNSFQHLKENPNLEANDGASVETARAIRQLQLDMENNRFCYLPPRGKIKNLNYLFYTRKKDEGAFTYVAHADYYVLLRSCATIARVDIRLMHLGVMSFESRLAWLEKRIDHCLHLTPPSFTCEFCSDPVEHATAEEPIGYVSRHSMDDPLGLSNLNI